MITSARLVLVWNKVDNVSNLLWWRVWNKAAGILGLLAKGVVSGTMCMFVKYELVVTQRQLLMGVLVALGPHLTS